MGVSAGSSQGMAARSMSPPRSASCRISGMALDRPPAPTSWMLTIGFFSPRAQQRSMTSWQRRSISGLSRCTEAKSSSSLELPPAIDEAAPPPRPISIAGPPSTTTLSPGCTVALGHVLVTDVGQAAGDHDRLVVAATHAGLAVLGLEGRGNNRPGTGRPNSLLKAAAPSGPSRMISKALAKRAGSGRSFSHGRGRPGMRRCDTEKPVRPALGLPPRPVAPFVADLAAGAGGRTRATARSRLDGCASRP